MQRISTVLLTVTCWLSAQPTAFASVEGQTFIADVLSLQAGPVKVTLGFLTGGVVGIDIPNAPDAVGDYTQNGTSITLVRCQFTEEDGVTGRFFAVANDPKQTDPAGTGPASILGYGFTSAGDIFFFTGEELVTTSSTAATTPSTGGGRSSRKAARR